MANWFLISHGRLPSETHFIGRREKAFILAALQLEAKRIKDAEKKR